MENDPMMLMFGAIPDYYQETPPQGGDPNHYNIWTYSDENAIDEVLRNVRQYTMFVSNYVFTDSVENKLLSIVTTTPISTLDDIDEFQLQYQDGEGNLYWIWFNNESDCNISASKLYIDEVDDAQKYVINIYAMDETYLSEYESQDRIIDLRNLSLDIGAYSMEVAYWDAEGNYIPVATMYINVTTYTVEYYNPINDLLASSFNVAYTSNGSSFGSVNVKDSEGKIVYSGGSVAKNELISIEVVPVQGYGIGSITINNVDYTDSLQDGKLSYKVSIGVSIVVIFSQPITGITLTGGEIEFTGSAIQLGIQGDVPNGVSVEYYLNNSKLGDIPSVVERGTYSVRAVLSGNGYETLTLEAVFYIVESTDPLLMLFGVEPISYGVTMPSKDPIGYINWRFDNTISGGYFDDFIKANGEFYLYDYTIIDSDSYLTFITAFFVEDTTQIQTYILGFYQGGKAYTLEYNKCENISLESSVISWQGEGESSYEVSIRDKQGSTSILTNTSATSFDIKSLNLTNGVYYASVYSSNKNYLCLLVRVRGDGEVELYDLIRSQGSKAIYYGGGNLKNNGTLLVSAGGTPVASGTGLSAGTSVTIEISTINGAQVGAVYVNGVDYTNQLVENSITLAYEKGEMHIWVEFIPNPAMMLFGTSPDDFTLHEVGSEFLSNGGYIWQFYDDSLLDEILHYILKSNDYYLYIYNTNYLEYDVSLHIIADGLDVENIAKYTLNYYAPDGYVYYYEYRHYEGILLQNSELSWQAVSGAIEYSFGITNHSTVGFAVDIPSNSINLRELCEQNKIAAGAYLAYAYPRYGSAGGDDSRVFELMIQVRGDGHVVLYSPESLNNRQGTVYFGGGNISYFGGVDVYEKINHVVYNGSTVEVGTELTIKITLINGSQIDKVFINGEDYTSTLVGDTLNYTVSGETHIWVTFTPSSLSSFFGVDPRYFSQNPPEGLSTGNNHWIFALDTPVQHFIDFIDSLGEEGEEFYLTNYSTYKMFIYNLQLK